MHLLNDKPNLQCEGVRLTIGRTTEQGRGNTRLCILQLDTVCLTQLNIECILNNQVFSKVNSLMIFYELTLL